MAWVPSLERLMVGNKRYVSSRQIHPHQAAEHRAALHDGQCPFAVILGCSDSRVPPEVIFDQGLGDLFVIRVAGNVIDDLVLASIEYAAAHLHTPLIMVLGHSQCGAITATANGGEFHGHLSCVANALQSAVNAAKDQPGELVNNAAKANARMLAKLLQKSEPILSGLVASERLKVFAAYYDMDSGVVEIL
ncbi:MAG: carbonic anhydrase [Candidatus Eisenbacteria sp.]|nr:carbonic anhydrase [Candidatus Eisenbacteria bacterium]